MSPNTDIAVAATPRGAPGARTPQQEPASAESFGAVLDEQVSSNAEPEGKPRKPADDSTGRKITSGDPEDPSVAQAPPIVSTDPAWQALLARVLSQIESRQSPPSPDAQATGKARAPQDPELADPKAVLPNTGVATAEARRCDSHAHAGRPGTVQPNAADAAFAAAALAADRRLGVDAQSTPADIEIPPRGAGDPPEGSAASTRSAQDLDVRLSSHPGTGADSSLQSDGKARAPFAGLLEAAGSGRGDKADEVRSVAVRHVEAQTHLPVTGEPMSQVANQIVTQVARDVKDAAQSAGVVKDPPQPVQTGTKVLNILLEPEALGSVNVRMRLSGDRLSIQLDVAEPGTLEMISKNQDSLHKSLANENIRIDSLTIRQATQVDPSASAQSGQGAANQGAGQSGGFAQQQGAAYSGERSRGQREADRQGKSRHEQTGPARDGAHSAGGIFL